MIRMFKAAVACCYVAAVALPAPVAAQSINSINFGDDASQWANDGECDDPRFVGPGMTETTLLESDIGHDATDCRNEYRGGKIRLVAGVNGGGGRSVNTNINFGDDASRWANDGECDDPRFTGPGMTSTTLLASDIGHDATDCRNEFAAGRLHLK